MPTATDFKDYYAILGVGKTATAEEIKRAYRKLARKYHPDVNPGNAKAEEQFKTLNEANEVLSDSETREKYDQFGQYWKQAAAGGAPAQGTSAQAGGFNGGQSSDFDQYSNFDDFINDLLGGLGGRSRTGRINAPPLNNRTILLDTGAKPQPPIQKRRLLSHSQKRFMACKSGCSWMMKPLTFAFLPGLNRAVEFG